MSTTRRRLGALVSAGIIGLGVSACGGDEDAGEDDAAVQTADTEAEQTTEDEVTEEPEQAAETDDAGATDGAAADAMNEGEEIPIQDFLALMQEPGEETLSSYTMTMMMDAEGETINAEGAVDLSGDDAAMNLSMTMAELGDVEMIIVGDEIYMAMPGLTPEGMYLRAGADMLGQASGLEDLDVTSQWDAWEEGAQEVRYLGAEDVDGMQLEHYRIMVDAAAAAESMGEDSGDLSGVDTVVYDVWLDSDNLMRQVTFDLEGSSLEMSMDNWGEPQMIEAPSADQVMDMDEMMDSGSDG